MCACTTFNCQCHASTVTCSTQYILVDVARLRCLGQYQMQNTVSTSSLGRLGHVIMPRIVINASALPHHNNLTLVGLVMRFHAG